MVATERHVRVCIPHHFREDIDDPRYGSRRPGSRLARCLALGRCLAALLDLQRRREQAQLGIGQSSIDQFPCRPEADMVGNVRLEIHVCSDGRHQLDEVLQHFNGQIHRHRIDLADPRQLALAARDLLIQHPQPADLNLYLEDDLVISDRHYLDKMVWFQELCGHRMVLMPHRYERLDRDDVGVLLVDGPLRPGFIGRFTTPRHNVLQGRWRAGPAIDFDVATNPHSGSFCLSRAQVKQLKGQELPRQGFIGPMETAATLTVLGHFPVLKPALQQWRFLAVEHGHPTFRDLWHTRLQSGSRPSQQPEQQPERKARRIQFLDP